MSPRGSSAASLLYPNAKIGDVVRVEAEFHLDGIEILEVFAPKAKKVRSDLLELISKPLRDDELVTEVRARKGRDRDDRRPDRGRGDRKRPAGDRETATA